LHKIKTSSLQEPPIKSDTTSLLDQLELPPEGPKFSFGNQRESLFFSSDVTASLLQVLEFYESNGQNVQEKPEKEEEAFDLQELLLAEEKNEEEEEKTIIYPEYRLLSIVYNSENDWVVMINGLKITPDMNDSANEIFVSSLSNEHVEMKWSPQDNALIRDLATRLDAATQQNSSIPQPEENRIARKLDINQFSPSERVIRLELQPNQTFAPEFFAIYEGKAPQSIINNQNKSPNDTDLAAEGEAVLPRSNQGQADETTMRNERMPNQPPLEPTATQPNEITRDSIDDLLTRELAQ
jgi:hypothetical protein